REGAQLEATDRGEVLLEVLSGFLQGEVALLTQLPKHAPQPLGSQGDSLFSLRWHLTLPRSFMPIGTGSCVSPDYMLPWFWVMGSSPRETEVSRQNRQPPGVGIRVGPLYPPRAA